MAGSLVSGALNKISSVAEQQLKLFTGATHELERLSATFRSIESLLSDAESRQAAEERVHGWLSGLKHVAYDIDDVLDEGKILGLGEEGDDEGDFINKVIQYLLSPCNFFNHVVSKYKVACRVKEIRERLEDIAKDRNNYSFSSSTVGDGARSRRLETPFIMESEVMIGRENDREIMISRLVSGSSYQGGQVHVVAIVGIGGLGKTTLAWQLYRDGRVKNHFNGALYWVCVSETFDVTRITKEILEQVQRKSTSLTGLTLLQIELLKSLKGKRFLLVLDDVWNDDAERWETLGASLNSGAPESRILVTTRRDVVANTMNATYTHRLKGLSEEDSWSLFSSRAFDVKEVVAYSKLENVGRKMVNDCKGVPLTIKAIGSVMKSTKRTAEDWKNVANSKAWSEPKITVKVLPPLLLSYTHLPTHLRQCFAYCSMFPKDWKFNKDMLVRLWVAEGFVRSQGNREIEDVGAEHFDDLVAWSMFQEVQEVEDKYQGTVSKMHDLLHDLAEFVAKDDIYRFISIEGGKPQECPGGNVRHAFLSFTRTDDSSNKMPITLRGAKKLRTLYLCGVQDESHKAMVVDLFQQSRFLRAVVFEYSGINRLPNAIGKMKQLRYLDLSGSDVVELPESVTHLRNLHTLNLNDCGELKKLPRGIGRMASLRHLGIEGTGGLEYLPKGLGRISGLRSLCKFIVGGGGKKGCRIDELQRLDSLHGSLHIEHLERVSSREEAEEAQLGNKPYLRRLALSMSTERDGDDAVAERMDDVIKGLRPHVNLEELIIPQFSGSRLPSWMAEMKSLRKLEIWYCHALGSLPDSLGQLDSLQHLQIFNCEKLESLPHSFGLLKVLNHLEIRRCNALRSLPDSLGQLESLQQLQIFNCEKLESLPHSFGQLKALNHLNIWRCSSLGSLPDSLGGLESLQHLQITECAKLESLARSFGQLKALNHLEISNCEALRSLPDSLGPLESLQQLKITDCEKLESLPHSFGQLKALNHLDISYCRALRSLPDSLGQLESLQRLQIFSCEKLESLPHSFGQLKALNHLCIWRCSSLGSLPDSLGELESLQHLQITECAKLESLPHSFGQLKALNHLEISNCEALRSLPDSLGPLESLQQLKITDCEKLESLPHSFGQLKALNQLEISNCDALRSLPDSLGQLESLQRLKINCKKLESLPHSFGQLKALNHLDICCCSSLGSLPDSLGELESLQHLQIRVCAKLESLPHSFGQLKALNQLEVSWCGALGSLPDSLGQLESLQHLQISKCDKLESLPHSFGQLKALNHLEISNCKALRSLPDSLGQLESLQHLRIENCEKLESLPRSLGQLKALNRLEISYCHLGSLPDGLQHVSLLIIGERQGLCG